MANVVLKVTVKILVCDRLILTVRRVTRGLADSINELLGTFVTNVLSLAVYRSPTRPETCSRTCMHYRREDKCTQHHRDIAPCCDRTGAIDPIDFGYIEWQMGTSRKCLERTTRRIDDSLPARNKWPSFHRVIALPRTILISRLPIKASSKTTSRSPTGVTELYGPLLIFMARKQPWGSLLPADMCLY